MTHADKNTTESSPTSSGDKIKGLISGLAMFAVVAGGLAIMVPSFFSSVNNIIARHPYVKFNAWDLPFFVGVPMFIALGYGVVLRLLDKATDDKIQKAMKIALIFAGLVVITRIAYGFAGSNYLTNLGYSSCWSLSSPSLMTPTVYVKQPEYCLDNVGHVRKDLLHWIDNNTTLGEPLDTTALQNEANRLMTEWNVEYGR